MLVLLEVLVRPMGQLVVQSSERQQCCMRKLLGRQWQLGRRVALERQQQLVLVQQGPLVLVQQVAVGLEPGRQQQLVLERRRQLERPC